jgi:Flp pilus assembly protein CpaB
MRKLNLTIIAGALIALIGVALVVAYGRGVDDKIADGKKTTPVLVATSDLPAGASAADVRAHSKVKQVPREYAVAQPLASAASINAASVLLGPAPVGTQLSTRSFGTAAAAATLTPSPGNVALAVSVGLVPGVARYVTPGSKIDLFFTGGSGGVKVTKLFATNVKVLSTTPAGGAAEGAGDVLVIVDVTPTLAQRIVVGLGSGSLYFALNAEGREHGTGAPASPNDLLVSGR